jgi:predicted nuclease of restriction endonuclease-like (RecB) superfamily
MKKITEKEATVSMMKAKKNETTIPSDYPLFLEELKIRIRAAQVKAVLSANRELIQLYWSIGRDVFIKQKNEGWGSKIVDRLASDLHHEFPEMEGFSRTNIYRMRAFYQAYSEVPQIVPQPVGQSESVIPAPVLSIPWGHNVILIERVKDPLQRVWYAQQTIENGWSRTILAVQIENNLYQRQGKAVTNFSRTLPAPGSDAAQQALKDPYVFKFLTLDAAARERDLEQGLVDHIQKFLLELGVGFSFVGRQYPLEIEDKEYFLDLLFYHLKLRCYVVIDLKMGEFAPEHAGKMNFYLSAVDDLLRSPDDKPTIGLLLCKDKKHLTVEYALRDMKKPIGVAEWRTKLIESLPKHLQGSLPTVEELEAELAKEGKER